MTNELKPLPYHLKLRDYLKANEPESWRWFSSAESLADYTESLRLDLLKHTYRLDTQTHSDIYETADETKRALCLDIPVTLYQSQQGQQLNAALFYIPGEAHIVFEGQILSLMEKPELKSVIAHELSHYRLWQEDAGEFLVAHRMISAIACDARAHQTYMQSARWYNLYTEIYADRGALLATSDKNSVVSSLIKIQTGLSRVSAESYVLQADEIFSKTKVKTEELTHPEAFIRARAIELWSNDTGGADPETKRMIEGSLTMNELDVLGQQRLTEITKKLIGSFLRPSWFQTDLVLGHARFFFDDLPSEPAVALESMDIDEIEGCDTHLRQYLAYVILDFATVDTQLERAPVAAALKFAGQIGIGKIFEEVLTKELKIGKKEIDNLKNTADEILKAAEEQAAKHGREADVS